MLVPKIAALLFKIEVSSLNDIDSLLFMKRTLLTFCLLFLFQRLSLAQNELIIVHDKLSKQLDSILPNSGWTLKQKKRLLHLEYADTFYRNTWMNPLYNHKGSLNQADKLFIKIRLEENWTQAKSDSLKAKNHKVLDPLIVRYNQSLDSAHPGIRDYYRSEFKEHPYTNLKRWVYRSEAEKKAMDNFIRLPDTIITKIGVFVDLDYSPSNCYLEPDAVRDKVDAFYSSLSRILGERTMYKRENPY